jgi:hypothetical protein
VVKKGKARAKGEGRCPAGTEAEMQVVFYQSRTNYVGEDNVSYEVRTGDQVRVFSIVLSVNLTASYAMACIPCEPARATWASR